MNWIFNFGFIAITGAGLHRYFISEKEGTKFLDFMSMGVDDLKLYGIAVIWLLLALWNILRYRCPKCRSTKYGLLEVKELDRWVGTKNVKESLNDGSSTTRAVSTTFVKLKKVFCCYGHGCDHHWHMIVKEEKR